MRRFFKHFTRVVLVLVVILIIYISNMLVQPYDRLRIYLSLNAEPELLVFNGFQYRDLNRNQRLDNYEDSRLTSEIRTDDLLSQMTL